MPWHSAWWHDVIGLIPFIMAGQLKRSTDFSAALFGKIVVALVISLATGAAGGALGAYVAIHIQDYRLTQLEKHEAEDKAKFERMQEEITAIRERHRLEELNHK